ncbi:hypothetical protein T45_01319 [Streptomyces turgidiscabies]|nr:hypothetical protein T45_01319 [Streptomyces turgidiscabies]
MFHVKQGASAEGLVAVHSALVLLQLSGWRP